ncbi:hypothetical protein BC827DRAFT_1248463 [Russula dissimulans]|nr:hypothetical protein BC827DRAFT_1248463 [Russula dissimulans]
MSYSAFQFSPDPYDASVPIPNSGQPASTHLLLQPLPQPPFPVPEPINPGQMPSFPSYPVQDPEKLGLTVNTGTPFNGRRKRFWILLGVVIGLLVIIAIGVGVGISTSHHSSSSSGNGSSSSSSDSSGSGSSSSSSSGSSSGGGGSGSSSSSSSSSSG